MCNQKTEPDPLDFDSQVNLSRAALRAIEWVWMSKAYDSGDGGVHYERVQFCPSCLAEKSQGHRPGCSWGASMDILCGEDVDLATWLKEVIMLIKSGQIE